MEKKKESWKRGWEGKEDNETGRIAVLVHRRISCKVFCNFARTLSSN